MRFLVKSLNSCVALLCAGVVFAGSGMPAMGQTAAPAEPQTGEPVLVQKKTAQPAGTSAPQPAQLPAWNSLVMQTLESVHSHGPGGYKASGAAMDALLTSFEVKEGQARPVFHPEGARPSFCSGAVYMILLGSLCQWDAQNAKPRISAEAWKALLPRRAADGVRPWGYVNANGPGLAVLVHQLGAGFSFTDISQARTGDFMKIWWNDEIGAKEHGHLVVFISDLGDKVRVWSSNLPRGEEPGGYGYRDYTKESIHHALYTRITDPAAFNGAPKIQKDAWLASLLNVGVTWEETLQRSGVGKPAPVPAEAPKSPRTSPKSSGSGRIKGPSSSKSKKK